MCASALCFRKIVVGRQYSCMQMLRCHNLSRTLYTTEILFSSHLIIQSYCELHNHSHRIIALRVERSHLTHSQLYHFSVHTRRILIIFRFIMSDGNCEAM